MRQKFSPASLNLALGSPETKLYKPVTCSVHSIYSGIAENISLQMKKKINQNDAKKKSCEKSFSIYSKGKINRDKISEGLKYNANDDRKLHSTAHYNINYNP